VPPCREPKLYVFSVTIGAACTRQFRRFQDLAEKRNFVTNLLLLAIAVFLFLVWRELGHINDSL
jgi:hypothetical protein